MRSETEWLEPLDNNNNILYDYKTELNKFIENFLNIEIIDNNVNCNASQNILKYIMQ